MSHIQIRNLSVHYGDRRVLRNITLDVPDGQLVALIGPSGCGKTTFLKSLNRLLDLVDDTHVTGQVLIDGEDIYGEKADVAALRKKIGFLSQRPYPLPMSIHDNIAFGPRIHGMEVSVEHYLRLAGLWEEVQDRLHTPASRLSIGQQQRLALARALAVEPGAILADEPTSALDPHSVRIVENQFRLLKRDYTVLMVTHILRQARRLADYIVFFYLGELVEHGPAEAFFTSPKDDRTKAYVSGEIS